MNTCTIETGLLRKKPCGYAAVARCLNCDQPLCVEHSVAQLTEAGHKTGKFMCPQCVAAAKEHAKSMAAVARSEQAKKLAATDKILREQLVAASAPVKKPAASTPHAPAEPAPAEKPKEPDILEFIPKDGKLGYTRKEDEPGYKPD
ncbi:MAG TPA: hypothetical protein VKR31_06505 [Rhizomicrobium sp.]|nr:hypothetical protein [Rhizomicrobium sp.]